MFVYGADSFLVRPGLLLTAIGLILLLMQTFGPVSIGKVTFSMYWQLLGAFLFVLGTNTYLMGVTTRGLFDYTQRHTKFSENLFSYNRGMLISGLIGLTGIIGLSPLIFRYITEGLRLSKTPTWQEHIAIIGLTLVSLSGEVIAHILVYNAIKISRSSIQNISIHR